MKTLLGAVSLGLGCLSLLGAASELRIGTTDTQAAFEPMVAKVFLTVGIPVTFITEPHARILEDLRVGHLDGGFFFAEAALKYLPGFEVVPVTLYRTDYVAVVWNPLVKVRAPADLAKYSVAYPRSFLVLKPLVDSLPQTFEVNDEIQGFKMLGSHRIDVFLVELPAVQAWGKAAGVPLYVQQPPLSVVPIFLVISKNFPRERDLLASALKKRISDGTWDQEFQATVDRTALKTAENQP